MTPQQVHELEFWRNLQRSVPDFYAFRAAEFHDKIKNFPGFMDDVCQEDVIGLDLGCGPISIFEGGDVNSVVCIDALWDTYAKELAISQDSLKFPHEQGDGEHLKFADNLFNWVFCVNMIDHTPNPAKMVEEIHRVLKSDGYLFMEVHFDDHLHGPHFFLWNQNTVKQYFDPKFTMLHGVLERIDQHQQYRYWAVMQKRG